MLKRARMPEKEKRRRWREPKLQWLHLSQYYSRPRTKLGVVQGDTNITGNTSQPPASADASADDTASQGGTSSPAKRRTKSDSDPTSKHGYENTSKKYSLKGSKKDVKTRTETPTKTSKSFHFAAPL